MGVTIEQYRARIGAHNVKIILDSTQLEGNFCDTMLMLFQLEITIIIFMLIFYRSVIYLPTKRLTEQYKNFSQVIVSFTQMSCYNVCSNDVEENPGSTIYDVVDPSKTICADFSQGNTKIIRQNAGKQCVAMSLTEIIYNEITNINAWDSSFLNVILCTGNSLYTCISNSQRAILLIKLSCF